MEIKNKLHQIKINFSVTKELKRFVYLYIIEGEKIHIIDTGVNGTEKEVADYLLSIGRNINEVESILLTHSHPDHTGSASAIKNLSECKVYTCEEEKNWIEDIDIQFKERPIPNFYKLLNKSTKVDKVIKDNDIIVLEDGISIKIIETKGHSHGSLSFYWIEEKIMFTGDAVPVIGDIPIYISAKQSINSLEKILEFRDINLYLSAWDDNYDNEKGIDNIKKSIKHLILIDETVKNILENNINISKEETYEKVCSELNLIHLLDNPLFKKSIYTNIEDFLKI